MDPTPPDAYAGAQLRDGEVSTGTTIMAVSYAGGVVMGADSRVSTGTYIANRVSDKVSALHDKIFMCRSGSAADTQAVSDYVRHYLASHAIEVGAPPLVKTAASLAKRICYTNKEQLLAGVIVAGYDEVDGGSVYVIPLGGTCLKAPFAIGGSGSTYIANRVSDKVSALHDKIFMCRSGSAADTQAVSDYVRHYLASHAIEVGAPPLVKTAASLAKRICYTNKEQLLAGVIVAGYDEVDGGSVYVIPLGGTCLKAPFAIGGSGSTYIYGHVDHEFKPGMSLSECKAFVAEAIKRAMARDGSSGGIVRLVCINAEGVEREYLTV